MKNILVLLLLTLSVSLFQSLNAQEKNSSIEKAVLQLKEALLSGNEAQLRAISSKHLSYGHSNGLIENQDAFVATLISGKSIFLSIDLSEQTMDQVENTAIVRHTLYAKTNNEGVLGEVKLKVLMIFQKEKGAWRLLARQAVKIPI
ncbi:MAG: nuclear transport factor 2 family protein [Chitinophagaceae bacterium]